MNQIEGSTSIVTGANSGIGKAAATELARMGSRVVMVCRNRERGRQALLEVLKESGSSDVVLMLADLGDQSQVRDLASRIASEYPQIDVLVNNAGLIRAKRELTVDGHETTFAVNHLGYFLLTLSLLDNLRASAPARIVNVASGAHQSAKTINFDDLMAERRYSAFKVYAQSKLANILFTYELARRLDGTGVTANALHPGVVSTGFGRGGNGLFKMLFRVGAPFMKSPEEGARTILHLATSPDVDGITGQYYADEKPAQSTQVTHDTELAARLWSKSLELTGFDEDPLPAAVA